MASDGVFDNLYDNQIEKCLKMNGQFLQNEKQSATCIVFKSIKLAKKSGYLSPYAKDARDFVNP